VIAPDRKRIEATGAHIVRGLSFWEYGRVVEASQVWTRSHPEQASNDFLINEFEPIASRCMDRRRRGIGDGFTYESALVKGEAETVLVWLLVLYTFLGWFGVVRQPNAGQRQA
jgi:hypothetical protein